MKVVLNNLTILLFFYVCTVLFFRIFCGQHSVLEPSLMVKSNFEAPLYKRRALFLVKTLQSSDTVIHPVTNTHY